MLFGELVKYQGNTYEVTSTYDDGTVDLDYNLNVKRSEVELAWSLNDWKQTAQVAEVDQMFPPVVEVKASELD